MADRRMLSATVAEDEELNRLSIEAQLLFLMTIPHLDRDGLITGNPRVLFGRVCPLRDELRDRILVLTNEWVDQGLVRRYAGADGGSVLFFDSFMKHQRGIEYSSEKPSRFPPPPGWVRTKAGLVPEDGFLALTLAEVFDVRSAYRKVLLERAAGAGVAVSVPNGVAVSGLTGAENPQVERVDLVDRAGAAAVVAEALEVLGEAENGKSGLSRDVVATTSRLSPLLKPVIKPKLTMTVDDDGQISPSAPGSCAVGGARGGFDAAGVGLDEIGLRAFCVALVGEAFGTSWDAPQTYADGLTAADCQRLAGWLWKVIVRPEWSCAPDNPIRVGFIRSMMGKATARANLAPGEWRDLQAAAAAWAADPGAELFGGVVVPVSGSEEAEDGIEIDY